MDQYFTVGILRNIVTVPGAVVVITSDVWEVCGYNSKKANYDEPGIATLLNTKSISF